VIGRFFPISTLAAAAIGNLVSDIVGTYAAGGVKYLADLAGATEPDLASAQKALPVVRQTRLLGEMVQPFLRARAHHCRTSPSDGIPRFEGMSFPPFSRNPVPRRSHVWRGTT
jgi:hypothetical protein